MCVAPDVKMSVCESRQSASEAQHACGEVMGWTVQYLLGQELGCRDEFHWAIGPRPRGRYRSHHEWCVGQKKSQNDKWDGKDESRLQVFHCGGRTRPGMSNDAR